MKVRLDTLEINDDERRAIAYYYGWPGLATRENVRQDLGGLIDEHLRRIVLDYESDES